MKKRLIKKYVTNTFYQSLRNHSKVLSKDDIKYLKKCKFNDKNKFIYTLLSFYELLNFQKNNNLNDGVSIHYSDKNISDRILNALVIVSSYNGNIEISRIEEICLKIYKTLPR